MKKIYLTEEVSLLKTGPVPPDELLEEFDSSLGLFVSDLQLGANFAIRSIYFSIASVFVTPFREFQASLPVTSDVILQYLPFCATSHFKKPWFGGRIISYSSLFKQTIKI